MDRDDLRGCGPWFLLMLALGAASWALIFALLAFLSSL